MKTRSMQTCIMSSLPRCIFRCSVFRYVTLDNFFQTLLFNCNFFYFGGKYLPTYLLESTENLWYLCTAAGPDPDPNPRGEGQLPNPKSAILAYANECNERRDANP